MTRCLVLALLLLTAPALAKDPDPKPRIGDSPVTLPPVPQARPKIQPLHDDPTHVDETALSGDSA